MSLTESVDFEKVLHELFRYAYMSNCELMEEELSPEELETLQDLDTAEVLENFKDLILDLINYKRNSLKTEKSELIQQNEQFEGMLQKLEGEVRNHIRIEQQLKLHLESSQAKLDESDKKIKVLQDQLDAAEARLVGTGASMTSPVSQLEHQLKALEERYKHEISRLTLEHTSAIKSSSRHNRASSEVYSHAARSQQSRQSPLPTKKSDDRHRGYEDKRGLKFDLLKQKLDEKSKELEHMNKMLKNRTKDPLSERIKDEVLKEELEIARRLSSKDPPRPESRLSNKPTSAHKKSRSASSYRGVVERRQRSAKGTILV
jgi:hypothetical protein